MGYEFFGQKPAPGYSGGYSPKQSKAALTLLNWHVFRKE
jgi:hypothetical protein